MRDHSVPVERVVTATVLKFRRLSGVGYLSGTRIRFPTGCHLEYDVDLCAYFPEGICSRVGHGEHRHGPCTDHAGD